MCVWCFLSLFISFLCIQVIVLKNQSQYNYNFQSKAHYIIIQMLCTDLTSIIICSLNCRKSTLHSAAKGCTTTTTAVHKPFKEVHYLPMCLFAISTWCSSIFFVVKQLSQHKPTKLYYYLVTCLLGVPTGCSSVAFVVK